MINYTPASQLTIEEFKHPFERQLDPANRWVRMAQLVPWDNMASLFRKQMSSKCGRGSVDLRHVLGALLVKHIEGLYHPIYPGKHLRTIFHRLEEVYDNPGVCPFAFRRNSQTTGPGWRDASQ